MKQRIKTYICSLLSKRNIMENQHRIRIGLRIKELREQQGLTALQVAEAVGIRELSYKRIEEGKFSFSVDILEKIASVLGTRVDLI